MRYDNLPNSKTRRQQLNYFCWNRYPVKYLWIPKKIVEITLYLYHRCALGVCRNAGMRNMSLHIPCGLNANTFFRWHIMNKVTEQRFLEKK